MKKQVFAAAMMTMVTCVWAAPMRADIIEQVLVKVNGDIITKTELETRQIAALRQKMQGQQVDPAALKNDETLKKMLADITPQLIVNAVDELLLLQRGRDLGFHLGDDQFKQIVANIRKENKLEDEAKFLAALAQENMTLEDLRKSLEKQMLVDQVQRQEVGSKLNITEEEARQYYARHPEEFTEQGSITLREIFVEVPAAEGGVSVAKDEEAQKKIGDARTRALKGEDFAKLAGELSDSPSKANGGLIGPVNPEEMSTQLLDVVKGLKVGEVTQPIRSQRGWQLIKLESRSQTVVPTLEQVRNQVADKVFREKGRPELFKYLQKLREQAIIEWKNEEIHKVYEAQLAKPATPTTTGSN